MLIQNFLFLMISKNQSHQKTHHFCCQISKKILSIESNNNSSNLSKKHQKTWNNPKSEPQNIKTSTKTETFSIHSKKNNKNFLPFHFSFHFFILHIPIEKVFIHFISFWILINTHYWWVYIMFSYTNTPTVIVAHVCMKHLSTFSIWEWKTSKKKMWMKICTATKKKFVFNVRLLYTPWKMKGIFFFWG